MKSPLYYAGMNSLRALLIGQIKISPFCALLEYQEGDKEILER